MAFRLYIESELFIMELEVLAFLNHHVTFPFLNCIENCNRKDLLEILPILYHDLTNNSKGGFDFFKIDGNGVVRKFLLERGGGQNGGVCLEMGFAILY